MKAVVFDQVGRPDQVLRLADLPIPDIAPNEARVRMLAASISPGDFLFIEIFTPSRKNLSFRLR
jgi:NADPH2:quinone reductase